MIPSNANKFEKMKKVAALQTQKGPWSRGVSASAIRKQAAYSEGNKEKKGLASKHQSLQQQKGPWSRQDSRPPSTVPPPSPQNKSDGKRNKIQALQEQRGPWNRSKDFSMSENSNVDAGLSLNSPSNHKAPPPPPPPRTKSATQISHSTSGRFDSIKDIMTICTALNLFRKQRAVVCCSEISRYFHIWRRNSTPTFSQYKGEKPNVLSKKQKTKHSVLLWLSANSSKKLLRNAWKKWLFAVIASQNCDKNVAIENLSHALTKENEQYKSRLVDIMEKVKQRENVYRHNVVKSTMHNFFRIKTKLALKRRFDTWSRLTWQKSYDHALKREKFKMEIGFQSINSEKEVLKETEILSSKLQSTLLCLVAFSSWKLDMKAQQYTESQKKWSDEKRIIQDNLLSLQKSLVGLNRSEREMVDTARSRGQEMYSALHSISDRLGQCSSSSRPPLNTPHKGNVPNNIGSGGILKKTKKKLVFDDAVK